jgi:hypothetical protein
MSHDSSEPPSYTPSQPEVLVSPLADRLSYLNHDAVEGQVYVKGIAGGGQGDQALSNMCVDGRASLLSLADCGTFQINSAAID